MEKRLLLIEERLLTLDTPPIPRQLPGASDNAMAWDRDGNRICKAAQSDREALAQEDERKPDWSALDKLKIKKS